MAGFGRMEQRVRKYCERHNIIVKYIKRDLTNKAIEVEGFDLDSLEARITEKGMIVFKHNGKRTSLRK